MSSYKNIFIFADSDLDGAATTLLLKWLFFGSKVQYKSITEKTFRAQFEQWSAENLNKYDKVFICDLNVTKQNSDILDHGKITIIDHHINSDDVKSLYKNAEIVCTRTTSCALLAFKHFFKPPINLTRQQLYLILLANDYDCYDLKFPESVDLNTVYYSYQGDRLDRFCNDFFRGFEGFTDHQKNIIKYHHLHLNEVKSQLQIYKAKLNLGGIDYTLYSTFSESDINEVAQHLITEYRADIAIVVNTKTQNVSFRRNKNVRYNVADLARKLTNGDGYEGAAGGPIDDRFLMFSKIFQPI